MTLVALSAAYGAGGVRIGSALADRLGVPFLDRAIPSAVAARLSVSVDAAVAFDSAVLVLGNDERVLRVRLHGPRDRRIRPRSGSTPA